MTDRRAEALAYVVGLSCADATEPLWGPWGTPNAAFFEMLGAYGRSIYRWSKVARARLNLTDADVREAELVLEQYPRSERGDLQVWAWELLAERGVGLDGAIGDRPPFASD